MEDFTDNAIKIINNATELAKQQANSQLLPFIFLLHLSHQMILKAQHSI